MFYFICLCHSKTLSIHSGWTKCTLILKLWSWTNLVATSILFLLLALLLLLKTFYLMLEDMYIWESIWYSSQQGIHLHNVTTCYYDVSIKYYIIARMNHHFKGLYKLHISLIYSQTYQYFLYFVILITCLLFLKLELLLSIIFKTKKDLTWFLLHYAVMWFGGRQKKKNKVNFRNFSSVVRKKRGEICIFFIVGAFPTSRRFCDPQNQVGTAL